MYHGLQHFGGGDDALSQQTALCYYVFLNGRQFREGNFNAQVAAAYHDARALAAYVFYVVNAGAVFYFGDDVYVAAADAVEIIFKVDKVLPTGDKRRGDKVHSVLDAESQVVFVLIA